MADMKWQEMLAKAKTIFDEAKTTLSNPDAQVEDLQKFVTVKADGTQEPGPQMQEARSLKARALELKSIHEAGVDQLLADIDKKNTPDVTGKSAQFKAWGEYLYAVWASGHNDARIRKLDPRLDGSFLKDEEPKDHKDMSGQTGAGGGFLIPAEFQATLMQAAAEASIVRRGATVIPMRRRQLDIPVLDQTGTTAGIPHWFGGLRFYWAEEASAKTESDAAFKQITLLAHKLIGYTRVSDELLDDSAISLEAFFAGPLGFAGGVAWMEDYAFLRGNGAGQPLGIINAGATIVEPRNVANTIGFDDLADMMEDFLPSGRGQWIISQSAMSELIQMVGPTGNASYIWQPNARDGVPGFLLGFPVRWTEKLPRIGTQGDILLADMAYYVIGDRQATTVESTKFDRWVYDQTSWRVVHRVDGQPWLSAPLTLQDGTSQISPFVILGSTGTGT
jgi:HK97 family phage major capsid protein